MAFFDTTITMLRHTINDVDTPQTYDDTRLMLAILVGAQFVNNEFSLAANYVMDFNALTIIPDPTAVPDEWMVNLTVMRTGIIMLTNDIKIISLSAIKFKDIDTTVDMSSGVTHRKDILDELKELYKQASLTYRMGVRPAGGAILSPINISAGGRCYFPWYGGSRY